jgi:hypothetical protein
LVNPDRARREDNFVVPIMASSQLPGIAGTAVLAPSQSTQNRALTAAGFAPRGGS